MSQILFDVNQPEAEARLSFFSRQFAADGTGGQRVFDIVFGITAPVLCFFADPIVFKGGFLGGKALFGSYQVFAYLVSALAIVALVGWLLLEDHLGPYSSLIGGVFLAGALFSTIIGLVILPYSLLGLLFVIGLAGFTPFLTAFVYFRNGVRALNRATGVRVELKAAGALLAVAIVIGLPAIISYEVEVTVLQSVDELLNGDAATAQAAVNRLRWLPFIPEDSLDSVLQAYQREQDSKKKEILKKYYRDVTGEDIEHRLWILND
jgi:hypothetical protein